MREKVDSIIMIARNIERYHMFVKDASMKQGIQITIGLIPAIAIIALDVLNFCFTEQRGSETLALAFTTVICVSFGIALLIRKPKIAWWIYYSWWTFQLLPLVIALIYSAYLISNKSVAQFISTLLYCAIFLGLPSFFFRVALKGVDQNEESEKPAKKNIV